MTITSISPISSIISPIQKVQQIKTNKKIEPIQENLKNSNTLDEAYVLDLSEGASRYQNTSQEGDIYNSDILCYTKDLQLISKY